MAADAVVLVHFAFVVWVAAGGFLVLRCRAVAWLHAPAAAWAVLIEFCGWVCPLTVLEDALRGGPPTGRTFVERALMPILYPDLLQEGILTPGARFALGGGVLALNAAIYGWAFSRRARQRHRPARPPAARAP